MVYLYAITDCPDAPVPVIPGLDGVSLSILAYRDIGAAISRFSNGGMTPTETNLWMHEAVLEFLMADRTVLPVRFGTMLADESAVRGAIEAKYTDFAADLDRVRGRVELGLRILWDGDGGRSRPVGAMNAAHGSGRAYMLDSFEREREARNRRRQAETIACELDAPLVGLSAESVRHVLTTPRLLLTAAYLVERDSVATFREKVEAIGADRPELQFLCTGPWPPFNFVNNKRIPDWPRNGE